MKVLNLLRLLPLFLVLISTFAAAATEKDPCDVRIIQRSRLGGVVVWAPDGNRYLVNKEDKNGIAQVYTGKRGSAHLTCVTCQSLPGGPTKGKFKMQSQWHPSGEWIIMAAEQEKFDRPWFATNDLVEGWLQCGIWVDMYAMRPDGREWHKLQDFGPTVKADGFTGPAFTPDGKRAVWAQIVDGNVFKYSFGKWELIMADFDDSDGVPKMTNLRNITPDDTFWVEPGNFSPNGHDLLLSADTGFPDHSKVQGQDQYVLNVDTGQVTNLTNTPTIWDEHGVYSPDGEKIMFMSSLPYPNNSTIWNIKTEFMLMDKDGSNLRRVTRYFEKGAPEYSEKNGIAAVGAWSPDGARFSAISLVFPNYQVWDIQFEGRCGNQ